LVYVASAYIAMSARVRKRQQNESACNELQRQQDDLRYARFLTVATKSCDTFR
jgi:hypothetical protein